MRDEATRRFASALYEAAYARLVERLDAMKRELAALAKLAREEAR